MKALARFQTNDAVVTREDRIRENAYRDRWNRDKVVWSAQPTNLLKRLFLEERRRSHTIPQAFGERAV